MPDILLNYDMYKENMICDDKKCEYVENGYKFVYKDGIADLLPVRTKKTKYAPPYVPRPIQEPDFFLRHLPPTKEPTKLKWAIIITILLIFIVLWFFFVYEMYYIFIK
jgi:hypothetical protein